MDRKGQLWVLQTLMGMVGFDVQHPGSQSFAEALGYNHADMLKIIEQMKTGAMSTKYLTMVAGENETRAMNAEERGYQLSASELYQRAAYLYLRAQYTYFRDDPRKTALHTKGVGCYQKVMQLSPTPIERVEIPFEGKKVYAILHLPAKSGKVPCVLLVPGMDMVKEEWHVIAKRYYVSRGVAVMAIDGPGQGETLLHGLKVTIDNYEKAASAVVDYLVERPEIDSEKIAAMGVSMGSYWGSRIASHEPRLKACATGLGCYGPKDVLFNIAQPSYKINFMFMSGIESEAEFDEKFTNGMSLVDLIPKIKCPYLMSVGEFDELDPLERGLMMYESAPCPKELWVWENEFHPLGGVASEFFSLASEWILEKLGGRYDPNMDDRFYIDKDGKWHRGNGWPLWWIM